MRITKEYLFSKRYHILIFVSLSSFKFLINFIAWDHRCRRCLHWRATSIPFWQNQVLWTCRTIYAQVEPMALPNGQDTELLRPTCSDSQQDWRNAWVDSRSNWGFQGKWSSRGIFQHFHESPQFLPPYYKRTDHWWVETMWESRNSHQLPRSARQPP